MSTDLYDEFGLDAPGSDFDWDQFLPDSDAASADREDAGTPEPEPDDSDLGYSDVLDPGDVSDQGEAHSPRVEAALPRMEHPVQSSLDADPAPIEDPDLESEPELVLLPDAGPMARQSPP